MSENILYYISYFGLFKIIIGDIQEAGWSVKKPQENMSISDQDLRHVFDKVDRDKDNRLNRSVRKYICSEIYFALIIPGVTHSLQVFVQTVRYWRQEGKYLVLGFWIHTSTFGRSESFWSTCWSQMLIMMASWTSRSLK